jgi:hypothetical protein
VPKPSPESEIFSGYSHYSEQADPHFGQVLYYLRSTMKSPAFFAKIIPAHQTLDERIVKTYISLNKE